MIFCSFERCGEGVDLLSCFEFRVESCHLVALYSVCLCVFTHASIFSLNIRFKKKIELCYFAIPLILPANLQNFICNYVKAFIFWVIIYQPNPMSFS